MFIISSRSSINSSYSGAFFLSNNLVNILGNSKNSQVKKVGHISISAKETSSATHSKNADTAQPVKKVTDIHTYTGIPYTDVNSSKLGKTAA